MDQQQSAKIAYNLGVHAASLRREVDSNPFPKTWKGSDNPLHRIWELGYAEGMLGVLPKQRPRGDRRRDATVRPVALLPKCNRCGALVTRMKQKEMPQGR